MIRQIKRVQKFWLEFAGNNPIDKINDRELRDFVDWRVAYYGKIPEAKRPKNYKLHPTDKTLQWEVTLGKSVIKWATEKGYRGKMPLPSFSFVPKKKRVRPAFEIWEYSPVIAMVIELAPVWRLPWTFVGFSGCPKNGAPVGLPVG